MSLNSLSSLTKTSGKAMPGTAVKKKHLGLLFPSHKASLNMYNCGAVNNVSACEL